MNIEYGFSTLLSFVASAFSNWVCVFVISLVLKFWSSFWDSSMMSFGLDDMKRVNGGYCVFHLSTRWQMLYTNRCVRLVWSSVWLTANQSVPSDRRPYLANRRSGSLSADTEEFASAEDSELCSELRNTEYAEPAFPNHSSIRIRPLWLQITCVYYRIKGRTTKLYHFFSDRSCES